MNVSLSSRHSVHATREGSTGPACHAFGAPHGTEAYRSTTREVTCKKCLKVLAEDAQKEADYQDRLAASLEPATEAHELGHVHADRQAAADAQPEDIKAIRTEADAKAAGARYAAQLLAGKAEAAPVAYRPWGTDVLPEGVTMDADTRALAGPIKALLDLHRRGLATLDDAGDLILN